MCRKSSNTRSRSGPGGPGESREKRPACPQQPPGEQRDAAGGRTLPDVGRALRQAAAGKDGGTHVSHHSQSKLFEIWKFGCLSLEGEIVKSAFFLCLGFSGTHQGGAGQLEDCPCE